MNKAAFACLLIPAIVEIGLGVVYLSASEVMPYHKQALGVEWSRLEPGVRVMLVTFVNGYGSAHLAAGIAMTALLLFPLRRREAWARWTLLAIGCPVLGGTAWLSARLAAATGADVPWQGAVVLLILFVVGIARVDAKRRAGGTGAASGG